MFYLEPFVSVKIQELKGTLLSRWESFLALCRRIGKDLKSFSISLDSVIGVKPLKFLKTFSCNDIQVITDVWIHLLYIDHLNVLLVLTCSEIKPLKTQPVGQVMINSYTKLCHYYYSRETALSGGHMRYFCSLAVQYTLDLSGVFWNE